MSNWKSDEMKFIFQSHYEERCRSLEEIVSSHCNRTTFEEFVTQAFSPAPLDNLYNMADSRPASVSGNFFFNFFVLSKCLLC
jgi:hypothetical protein